MADSGSSCWSRLLLLLTLRGIVTRCYRQACYYWRHHGEMMACTDVVTSSAAEAGRQCSLCE